MKINKHLLGVIVILCMSPQIVAAQQYKISHSVIGSGGAVSANSNHRLLGTVAQPVIGTSQNVSNRHQTGFWYGSQKLLTTVEQAPSSNLPDEFHLKQNYPNPFNPITTISFDVKTPVRVTLILYNVLGHRVATLVDGQYAPGRYRVHFDARELPSGLYFYAIQMGEFRSVKKMIVSK
jgi:hypothetical protein